jgi:site-specific recombinase XerD
MLEELQRRNYSPETIRLYLFAVKDFAGYFGKRPDQLSSEHLRQYQLYLLNERKLSVGSVIARTSALRFFFTKVLRRPYREIDLVYPKRPERLPVILSEEEVARLIESAITSYHRVILMTLYGTPKQTSTVKVLSPGRDTLQRSAVMFKVVFGRDNSFVILALPCPYGDRNLLGRERYCAQLHSSSIFPAECTESCPLGLSFVEVSQDRFIGWISQLMSQEAFARTHRIRQAFAVSERGSSSDEHCIYMKSHIELGMSCG